MQRRRLTEEDSLPFADLMWMDAIRRAKFTQRPIAANRGNGYFGLKFGGQLSTGVSHHVPRMEDERTPEQPVQKMGYSSGIPLARQLPEAVSINKPKMTTTAKSKLIAM